MTKTIYVFNSSKGMVSFNTKLPPLANFARGVHINVHTLTLTFNNLYKKMFLFYSVWGSFELKEPIPFEELNT